MRVTILPAALADLDEGRKFYEQHGEGLGSYFLDSLVRSGGIHRKSLGYFKLLSRKFPFAVYYKLESDVVIVWRVLDCRRDPAWIRKQLS